MMFKSEICFIKNINLAKQIIHYYVANLLHSYFFQFSYLSLVVKVSSLREFLFFN